MNIFKHEEKCVICGKSLAGEDEKAIIVGEGRRNDGPAHIECTIKKYAR